VIVGGVVCGTWQLNGTSIDVAWFAEAGKAPEKQIHAEVERLSAILNKPLEVSIRPA
jgi:hypothetical protein